MSLWQAYSWSKHRGCSLSASTFYLQKEAGRVHRLLRVHLWDQLCFRHRFTTTCMEAGGPAGVSLIAKSGSLSTLSSCNDKTNVEHQWASLQSKPKCLLWHFLPSSFPRRSVGAAHRAHRLNSGCAGAKSWTTTHTSTDRLFSMARSTRETVYHCAASRHDRDPQALLPNWRQQQLLHLGWESFSSKFYTNHLWEHENTPPYLFPTFGRCIK